MKCLVLCLAASAVSAGCRDQRQPFPKKDQDGPLAKPASGPTSCAEEGALSREEDKGYVQTSKLRREYSEATDDTEREMAADRLVAELKRRFGGIDASARGKAAYDHECQFMRLMIEWNPIMFSVGDVKAVCGVPTKETPEMLLYAFDTGYVVYCWKMSVRNDVVVGIAYSAN